MAKEDKDKSATKEQENKKVSKSSLSKSGAKVKSEKKSKVKDQETDKVVPPQAEVAAVPVKKPSKASIGSKSTSKSVAKSLDEASVNIIKEKDTIATEKTPSKKNAATFVPTATKVVIKREKDNLAKKGKIPTNSLYATGKRKSSVARIYLWEIEKEEKGKITVNGRDYKEYFKASQSYIYNVEQPFNIIGAEVQGYAARIFIIGGGLSAQSQAIRHGIAKLFATLNATYKSLLKEAKLLTRDARRVQPKKTGYRKARKREQWSKR